MQVLVLIYSVELDVTKVVGTLISSPAVLLSLGIVAGAIAVALSITCFALRQARQSSWYESPSCRSRGCISGAVDSGSSFTVARACSSDLDECTVSARVSANRYNQC